MESDLEQYPHNLLDHYPQQHQKQMNSGLTRYQSAPSSLFSSLLDDEFFNRPSSPETERIFAQFLSSDGGAAADGGSTDNFSAPSVQISPNKEVAVKVEPPQTPRMSHMNAETGFMHPPPPAPAGNFTSAPHNLYQIQPRPQPDSRSSMEYNIANSIGTDRLPPVKTSGGGNSNLTRHNSSPAGLFSNFQVENGYPMMRNRNLAPNSSENPGYGFPPGSWDNSAMIPSNRKRLAEEDRTISSEIQNVDTASRPLPILAHHLSLPKIPVEMSALDQLLQDSVACKIRAKRGCATHPRSIAERVRRTKISERMRKLQDLVPNMDKQTNTSDMLDLAVEYIKDLQTQVKSLSDARANCKCAVGN